MKLLEVQSFSVRFTIITIILTEHFSCILLWAVSSTTHTFQSVVPENSLSIICFISCIVGFGSLSLVKPLWPLFLCFSFGVSSWPISWLVYIPAFSRFQICSRSSVCSISLSLRALNMLQPLDWFVSAAFTTHHILRKSQQLAHKGLVAIPRLHLPALRTEQHILAGLWMGAEGLQASGVWECLPPPGVALQPGICWAPRANELIKIPGREELETQKWALCR